MLMSGMLVSGCASYRFSSSMETPRGDVELPIGTKFRIDTVSFSIATNAASGSLDFGALDPVNQDFRGRLSSEALRLYPQVFTDDPSAIPLAITILRSGYDLDVGADSCISCLTLTILPMRSTDRTDYRVDVAAVPARDIGRLNPVVFTFTETSWLSLFPTGWIPVPGGTGDRAWGMDRGLQVNESMMLRSTIDAIVTIIRRTDPSDWKEAAGK